MHRFSVFAPFATTVEVVIGTQRHPMEPDRSTGPDRPGWWAVEVSAAGPGTDYAFSLDGAEPRPDPRSSFQPAGVEGPSRVVDHGAFGWTDGSWTGIAASAPVLYELHVGTLTEEGTFEGAARRLDHLVDLGVDAVELMPVAEASGDRGWGYDGVDWFAPHHAYGGPDGLKGFVDAAHSRGIGVVMDVVYNHLGPAGNYLAEFGPYFTDRYRTNWGEAVNFDDAYSDEVRRFVVDNARMWLADYHCDGLRLDAVHAIYDRSAVNVLEQLALEVRRLEAELGRPFLLIAESDLNDPRFVRAASAGGYGLDAAWADEFHHALHAVLTGERTGYYEDFGSLAQLAKALTQAWVYAGDWSPHRKRRHGRSPAGLGHDQFVVFMQNHDQIGNRAAGDRIGATAGFERVKAGAALTILSPFAPLLFQGEEWFASTPFQYFTDHRDEDLGRAVSEGRRAEFSSFGWAPEDVPDPQDEATFERSRLDWSELSGEPHQEMLEWYRSLISLRRRLTAPSTGVGGEPPSVRAAYDEEQGWLTLSRPGASVAVNFGPEPASVPFELRQGERLVLSSDREASAHDTFVYLPPGSVAVMAAP